MLGDRLDLETCGDSACCEGSRLIGSDRVADRSSAMGTGCEDSEREGREDDGNECSELHVARCS